MLDHFLEAVYRELEIKIIQVEENILSGTIQSMENYRQLFGRKEGLEVAYNCIKDLYKKIILNEEERHDGKSQSQSKPNIERLDSPFY